MPARPTPSRRSAWLGRLLLASTVALVALPAAAADAGQGAPAPLARLEIVDRGGQPEAWAENLLAGPIEVVLRAIGVAPSAEPALPARATVPARARVLVSRIGRADAPLVLEVVPGHPGARPLD